MASQPQRPSTKSFSQPAATPAAPAPTKPWAIWPLRVVAVVATVLIFDQAVFAGQFLAGNFGALASHGENATFAGLAAILQIVAAVVLWRPGRGPLWPALACAGMFGLIALQIVAGYARMVAIHVPLGVLIIVGMVLIFVWAWSPRRTAGPVRDSRAQAEATTKAGRS